MGSNNSAVEDEYCPQEEPQEEPKTAKTKRGRLQENRETSPDTVNAEEWRSLASFMLELQIHQTESGVEQRATVFHPEGNISETWSNFEDEGIYQWILNQVKESVQLQIDEAQEKASTATIEITNLQIVQAHAVSSFIDSNNKHLLANILKSNEPLSLEVSFKVLGQEALNIAQQPIAYQIQGEFRDRMTGITIPIVDCNTNYLVEGQQSYTVYLMTTTLPAGLYRLQIAIVLPNTLTSSAFLEIPMLEVV